MRPFSPEVDTVSEDTTPWIEVWKGADEHKLQSAARTLDGEGILMRRAWDGTYCETQGGISLLSLFRRKRISRLLVAPADAERARTLLNQSR